MLSKVLDKSTCAECRFCCSFRRCSLWETPLFDMETVDRLLKKQNNEKSFVVKKANGAEYGQMDLLYKYKTDDPQEEAPCDYLDPHRGCILDNKDKPFDCKIWPLRIMKMENGRLVIALTPTCPAINKQPLRVMKELVDDGLADVIYQYAKDHPFIIKEYHEGFPVLKEFD